MDIEISDKLQERVQRLQEDRERGVELSRKIAELIAAERVTVEIAERALRHAETIVRTRTVVEFTRP